MDQRLSLVTIGVRDLDYARSAHGNRAKLLRAHHSA